MTSEWRVEEDEELHGRELSVDLMGDRWAGGRRETVEETTYDGDGGGRDDM